MKIISMGGAGILAGFSLVACGGGSADPDSGATSIPVSTSAAMHSVTPPSPLRLPKKTVFKGESKFQALVAQAERENWRALPLGQRTVRAARAMVGVPYVNYTLEVDDRIENPVVNFRGMDCWTYYENALAFARMLRYKPGPYRPEDMLHMVEIERYRGGVCNGSYLSRMHHLEEVFHDNQKRGYAKNITSSLPGAVRLRREIREMTVQWKSYRYLRNNPEACLRDGQGRGQGVETPGLACSNIQGSVDRGAPSGWRHLCDHIELEVWLHLTCRSDREDQGQGVLQCMPRRTATRAA